MNVQVTSRPTVQPAATSKLAIADGDIHPQRNSYKDLFPYMEARWVEMAKTFGSRPRQAYQAGPAYPKGQPNASRRDAWPPERTPRQQPAVPAEAAAGREQHPRSAS